MAKKIEKIQIEKKIRHFQRYFFALFLVFKNEAVFKIKKNTKAIEKIFNGVVRT